MEKSPLAAAAAAPPPAAAPAAAAEAAAKDSEDPAQPDLKTIDTSVDVIIVMDCTG
jgi:uncharacterized protein YggE